MTRFSPHAHIECILYETLTFFFHPPFSVTQFSRVSHERALSMLVFVAQPNVVFTILTVQDPSGFFLFDLFLANSQFLSESVLR